MVLDPLDREHTDVDAAWDFTIYFMAAVSETWLVNVNRIFVQPDN